MKKFEIPPDLDIPPLTAEDKERADKLHAESVASLKRTAECIRATGTKTVGHEELWRQRHPGEPYPGPPEIGPTLEALRRRPPEQRALYLYVMTRED